MEYLFAGTKHSIKESKANTKCFNFFGPFTNHQGAIPVFNKDFQS